MASGGDKVSHVTSRHITPALQRLRGGLLAVWISGGGVEWGAASKQASKQ